MKVTVDVTDCRDCPFRGSSRGHGECWEQCDHNENGRGAFKDILWGCQEDYKKTPEWCPLGLGAQT